MGKGTFRVDATGGSFERLRAARVVLAQRFPYLASVLFQVRLVETEAVATMAVDDRLRVYFNPEWTASLGDGELLGVLFHEVSHWLRGHTGERGRLLLRALAQDLPWEHARVVQNLAADLAVNGDLRDMNLALPEGSAFPEDFGLPLHETMEAYAEALKVRELQRDANRGGSRRNSGQGGSSQRGSRRKSSQGGSNQEDSSQGGSRRNSRQEGSIQGGSNQEEGEDGRGTFPEDSGLPLHARPKRLRVLQDLWPELGELQEAVDREAPGLGEVMGEGVRREVAWEILRHTQSRSRGTVPLGLERWARERLEGRVDWRALLRRALRQALLSLRQRRFPNYALPHRRAEALDPFILPGKHGRKPRVGVVVDTSGSVSEGMLAQALAEVERMVAAGAVMTVYGVDAEVHTAVRVSRRGQARRLVLGGGGGTDMGRGLKAALADGHDLVVVLTDGYTPWPSAPPQARVVVGLLGDGPEGPPWAKTVRIELEDSPV
ncbi:VWA-like domain-containing protein [Thermus sp. 2.9]|uniref:vWA domain-containing protein n=1 Tax=Thermus sp. (strain 2.9) TaxID=1577051 RepID=UPI0009DCEB5C|nr:VWA-like domain-containing protein [Thermus sp. 2.9]